MFALAWELRQVLTELNLSRQRNGSPYPEHKILPVVEIGANNLTPRLYTFFVRYNVRTSLGINAKALSFIVR